MKLWTDLDCLAPPVTGIGHYTWQLMRRLLAHGELDDAHALFQGRWLSRDQIATLMANTHGSVASGGKPSRLTRLKPWVKGLPLAHRAWHHYKRYRFHTAGGQQRHGVYWEPNFLLKPCRCPSAVTVYDLSPLALPQLHPSSRVALFQRELRRSVEHATRIITISAFTAGELQRLLGVSPARICRVSPAPDAAFRPLHDTEATEIRQRYALPPRYILSIGTLEPRKNLPRLLAAYERLPDRLRQEWPLVCIGAQGWLDAQFSASLDRLERRGELRRLGYVPQSDLPALTAAAGLLAYLSVYEGFGMPVVEAMACGVPVLTSRDSAMHEVTGETAFLADPLDVDAIHAQLLRALEDPATRRALGERGPGVAARYSWDDSAAALLDTLRAVGGG